MSLQNLFSPNNDDLYCHNLTSSGTITGNFAPIIPISPTFTNLTVTNNTTLNNLGVTGTSTLNNVNIDGATNSVGVATFGNSVNINGSPLAINSATVNMTDSNVNITGATIIADDTTTIDLFLPTVTIPSLNVVITAPNALYGVAGDLLEIGGTYTIHLKQFGSLVMAYFPQLTFANPAATLAGQFSITMSAALPAAYLPINNQLQWTVPVAVDSVLTATGILYYEGATNSFALTNSGRTFTGTMGATQGIFQSGTCISWVTA